MRVEIPISHIVQMLGLCHSMKLRKAHYICHSQGQGILIAEVTWSNDLYDKVVYPRLKKFADMWSVRAIPARFPGEEKRELINTIRKHTFVREIADLATLRQLQQEQQMPPSKDN